MITREELNNSLLLQGLTCYEVAKPSADALTVVLKSEQLDELIRFAKTNNIKNIFYNYIYYNKESFFISEEHIKGIEKDAYNLIVPKIEAYNRKIESFDFSRALGINIFCIYQGQAICIRSFDVWHEAEGLFFGEQKLQQLVEENKKIIEEAQRIKQQDDEMLLKELHKYILQDPEFKTNTFPGARRDYIRSIFTQRKETQKYRHLLFDEDDINYINMRKAVDFIEILWREKNGL